MSLERIARENIIARPIKKLVYGLSPEKVTVDENQYIHILDRKTGQVSLLEGPARRVLAYDEKIVSNLQDKIVLTENEYCHIKDRETGDVITVEGPSKQSLRYADTVLDDIKEKIVLSKDQYCHIKNRETGEVALLEGPVRKTPHFEEQILKIEDKIILQEGHYCHIKDRNTGNVQTIEGPLTISLKYEEQIVDNKIQNKIVLEEKEYCHIKDKKTGNIRLVEGPARISLNHSEKLEGKKIEGNIDQKFILQDEDYIHVKDKKTGRIELIEGPARRIVKYHEEVVGDVKKKLVLPENHYCLILNPFSEKEGNLKRGEREVRVGPQTFALHYEEKLEVNITPEHVLTKYDGLLIKAKSDFKEQKAGDKFVVKGPKRYIPSKYEEVLEKIEAIPLSDTDGIYVQNEDTGEVDLVKGPKDYFLAPNEKLWKKVLTDSEKQGLGLLVQNGGNGIRVLTRQAANTSFLEDSSNALVLELEDNEVVFLYDGSKSRIVQGPETIFIGPYERPKVLSLSGGKPVKQDAIKVALVKLGPDFIYDQVNVRTKDNAKLELDVTYKWRFDVVKDNIKKVFSIEDFIGYAAETLSSEIRSVAAEHDFEDFHEKSLEYITSKIFNGKNSRVFEENGFTISGIDIKRINPEDKEIAHKLNEAIKHNMDIYCEKLVLTANLESERQQVEAKHRIEKEKEKLIAAQTNNEKLLIVGKAINSAEASKINAESEAEFLRIVNDAKIEAKKKELATDNEAERQRLHYVVSELGSSKEYIELKRTEALNNVQKVIVPENSKFIFGGNGSIGTLID